MTKPAITLFAALLPVSLAQAAALAQEMPEPYRAAGWQELLQATGDLDKDGRDDLALVIEAPDGVTDPPNACKPEEAWSEAPARRLIVFLSGAGAAPAIDNADVLLRSDQGGVMGDPLQEIAIERGALVIENYGGSRWRWGSTLRFRHDGGAWNLIGMTSFSADSLSASMVEIDWNALSGKVKLTAEASPEADADPLCIPCRIDEACPERDGCYTGTKRSASGSWWFEAKAPEPVRLDGFRCWEDETGLYRQTGFQEER